MLRINTQRETGVLIIELEGKLAGPWVKELESSWRSAASSPQSQTVRVDLTSVDFIDEEGKGLLEKMHGEGVVVCFFNSPSDTRRSGPWDRMTERSIKFSSSRILPGQ